MMSRSQSAPATLLAFDTSTELLSVALHKAPQQSWCVNERGGKEASARLLPCIQELLAQAGLKVQGLDAIAFGRGPGAFTGLRTSCAVAQGLAFAAGLPVIGIDSLLIVAEDARLQRADPAAPLQIGVAMDGRMDEIYASVYHWEGGAWQVQTEAALYTLPALLEAWGDACPAVLAGSALNAFGARLALPARPIYPTERDRAAALLRLAQQKFAAGEAVDAALALPVYLRDKVALTTPEREAVRALKTGALP